jgi:hypothetical protein
LSVPSVFSDQGHRQRLHKPLMLPQVCHKLYRNLCHSQFRSHRLQFL